MAEKMVWNSPAMAETMLLRHDATAAHTYDDALAKRVGDQYKLLDLEGNIQHCS